MRIRDFNALNDLLFKYVFGRPERKNITIDFLNAVLDREGAETIADINFEDRSQDPEYEDGKQSMLDIKCTTEKGEKINIEVQVRKYLHMDKRTLYYWAKLYRESINRKEDYIKLKPAITINLLGSNLLPQDNYHSKYILYEPSCGHRLTNDLEIHFLEIKKLRQKKPSEIGRLEKWLAFLANKLDNEEMEELAMSETAINQAWDAISYYMLDEEQRKAYDGCEKAERDYYSFLAGAIEEGIEEGKIEMSLECLKNGIGIEKVAQRSGIPVAEIRKAAEENGIESAE